MSPVLVGRTAEITVLDDALRDIPGAVLLGGEAGLGKTRLMREFAARARAAGARLLAGGCLELGSDGLPFAPFTTILRGLVRDIGTDGVAALLPRGDTSGLARLLPEFGEPESDAATAEERARLFELVLVLLERLAAERPVALIIEDAHWADRSTRDLLAFLVRNLSGAPLLIVVTHRSDELHRTHPLRALLAELGRVERVRRLDLAPLGVREVGELAAQLLGHDPGPGLALRLHERSGGNPLFVEALLDADGTLACELPESLRDLLLAGIQRLPEDTQELLRVAAVGGVHVDHALLAAVSGEDDAALSRLLRPAVAANALLVSGDGYAFRHALIREAVHDDLLPGEHTRLHARFAEALEADAALMPAGRRWVAISHHWHAAHDALWALVSAWRAAAESRRALAYAESLTMLSRVMELWDQVPDAEGRIEAPYAEVLRQAAAAAEIAGEYGRGITIAKRALRELPEDGTADRRRLRAALLEMSGRMRHQLAKPGFLEDLREAVRLLPDEATAQRARALTALATYGRLTTDIRSAQDAAAEALRIAVDIGDATAEADARITLLCADMDYEHGLAQLADAEEAVLRSGAHRIVMRFAVIKSHFLEGAGRHAEAAEVARKGAVRAAEFGVQRTQGAFLTINVAEPLLSLGRWDEAAEMLERGLELDPPITTRTSLQVLSGELALARGDLAAARARLASSRGILAPQKRWTKSQDTFAVLRLEMGVLLAEDRPREALEAAYGLCDQAGLPDGARYAWPVLVLGTDAAVRAGDPGAAAELERHAAAIQVRGSAQEAWHRTFRAGIARLRGEDDVCAWDEVAASWEKLGCPYPRAEALLHAAQAALSAGDHDAAHDRLTEALELTGTLRAALLHERLADLARRVRRPRRAGGGAAAAPLGLTPRELEVLRLVADGHGNRDIAAALFISAKTASVHVSNILGKLGVANRGEAAATAHRLGLFDEPA
ncbi:AAA family ATPase [Actinomadura sp. PM05-2]|uniref:AAA family ATPase n=2 Tax=Actinomadura parmotrematis TaxID=2864039 RepID=A0ABS7FZ82_9ACTN|nr:AAA family ATPase [Actinomadura parmotrematis]